MQKTIRVTFIKKHVRKDLCLSEWVLKLRVVCDQKSNIKEDISARKILSQLSSSFSIYLYLYLSSLYLIQFLFLWNFLILAVERRRRWKDKKNSFQWGALFNYSMACDAMRATSGARHPLFNKNLPGRNHTWKGRPIITQLAGAEDVLGNNLKGGFSILKVFWGDGISSSNYRQ